MSIEANKHQVIADRIASELHALADFIAERPDIAAEMQYSALKYLSIFPTAEDWPNILHQLGSFSKETTGGYLTGGYLTAVKQFGDSVALRVHVRQQETCERVQVGEQPVEREVYPDDVKPTIVHDVEPVYEWVCPDSWIGEK